MNYIGGELSPDVNPLLACNAQSYLINRTTQNNSNDNKLRLIIEIFLWYYLIYKVTNIEEWYKLYVIYIVINCYLS